MESGQCSTIRPKTARKIIEKNRRNNMKNLYSKLFSLLPNPASMEALPLPDQIDETVNYIKSMQTMVEKSKEKKDNLLGSKRSHTCMISETKPSSKSPYIEIHEIGPALDEVLICGLDNHSVFYEIIRVLHEEGAEILYANFSVSGNSIIHIVREKIGESRAATISERLKEIVNGTNGQVESQLEVWDFEIQYDAWEFQIPEVIPIGI
ncbi:unnamed protein product [Ilex paraguariensis]|uniref:BHLH domain-containing protein n=1 Tax=Ilex paraguariensis TaxID=185542 RepID=A0ABC8RY60_9AQUA